MITIQARSTHTAYHSDVLALAVPDVVDNAPKEGTKVEGKEGKVVTEPIEDYSAGAKRSSDGPGSDKVSVV